MLYQCEQKLAAIQGDMEQLRGHLDLATISRKIEGLSADMSASDFWNDSTTAQEKIAVKTQLEKEIKRWREIETGFEEASLLIDLYREENDHTIEEDIESTLADLRSKIDVFTIETLFTGPKDYNNAIVTIHPGAGGTESQDWAQMLSRMYLRWIERKGFQVETYDLQPGDEAGIKSMTIHVIGSYAYGFFKAEAGIHRLVRISPFDANKRRHTSFASVFVSPEIGEDLDIVIDEKDLRIDTYRASGAGGQHVNKTSSAVRITHLPSGVVTQCQNERSQRQNKEVALAVLKSRIYEIEQKKKDEALAKMTGEKKDIGWGNQIRSYIFQPYQMVKDHRTGIEKGNVTAVMDGEIDAFIEGFLKHPK
ncbi:MAG: peptide chain release factor 2 [Nitrospiria bacterium]